MKKNTFIAIISMITLGFVSCGSGDNYVDAREFMQDYINLHESLSNKIDQASNANEVADALNSFADKIQSLKPKIRKIGEDLLIEGYV